MVEKISVSKEIFKDMIACLEVTKDSSYNQYLATRARKEIDCDDDLAPYTELLNRFRDWQEMWDKLSTAKSKVFLPIGAEDFIKRMALDFEIKKR